MGLAHRTRPLIVFTDLDGTLLDHETYSWEAAKPALRKLKDMGHALVLASSKTALEIVKLREEIGFEHCPSIVENGGGILPANAVRHASSEVHSELISKLNTLPNTLRDRFRGFSDMSVQQIMACTGLSKDQASDAAQRQFTEPGLFEGSATDERAFVEALAEKGIAARMGGRFLTLSFGQDKSLLMKETASGICDGVSPFTIALGDAPNDVEMLCAADRGFLIPNPASTEQSNLIAHLPESVTVAPHPGPVGWNLSVLSVIDDETVE